jgi:hypothetical protein
MSQGRPFSEVVAQKAFFDVVGRALVAEGTATERLAEGLGKRFPDLEIQVVWRWSSRGDFAGHRWSGDGVTAESAAGIGDLKVLWRHLSAQPARSMDRDIHLYLQRGRESLSFALVRHDRDLLLFSFSGRTEDLEEFQLHLPSLVILYSFAVTEHLIAASADLARRLEKLGAQAEGGTGEPELGRLKDLVGEAKEGLENDELVRFLVSAAETAVAHFSACGADVRDRYGGSVAALISTLTDGLPQFVWSQDELAPRLKLVKAFSSICASPKTPPDPALDLMAAWTQLLVQSRAGADVEDHWVASSKQATTELAKLLQRWSRIHLEPGENYQPNTEPWPMGSMRAHHVPQWLRLWFCQEILLHDCEQKPKMSEVHRRRFREDLAYVLREGLRFFVFGRRADYRTQSEVLAQALRTLVEYHAVQVVKLPAALDVRGLLDVVSESQPVGGREFSAGHLQHIFEVYITGHFLAGLEWQGESTHVELVSVLIRPGAGMVSSPLENSFLQAFSLAALLHDCGRLLFPWWTPRVMELARFDRRVGKQLATVQKTLGDAAAEWLNQCRRELGEQSYLTTDEKERLAVWVGDRQVRGDGAAALLGAWYLHRIALRVDLDSRLRREAVRAVLLDGIANERLSAKSDPVAALLVLSDELFAWNPQPGLEVPFVHRLRSEGRPPPRFESIDLLDLEFRIESDGRVRGRFSADVGDRQLPVLPRFRVRLADPDGRPEDPVVETWLRLRQSLGRIELGLKGSWIEIESKIPQRVAEAGLDCRRLLSEIADRAPLALRPSLETWIGSLPEDETAPVGYERMSIQADGKPLHSGELEPYLPELERIEREVIQEFAARAARKNLR